MPYNKPECVYIMLYVFTRFSSCAAERTDNRMNKNPGINFWRPYGINKSRDIRYIFEDWKEDLIIPTRHSTTRPTCIHHSLLAWIILV